MSVVSVFSARPDGATSIAAGLAGVLSRSGSVLFADLAAHGPEVAPLLDVQDIPNVRELSIVARLTPVDAADLEAAVQWRDGIGVLAGAAEKVADGFMQGLVIAAGSRFDHVVVDLGRPRPTLPAALAGGSLLWVVSPGPLGMAALDRAVAGLEEQEARWMPWARVVLNRVDERSWRDVDRFIAMEYRMQVVARVPAASRCWRSVERRHSLAPFAIQVRDRRARRLVEREYGLDVWPLRMALEDLAGVATSERLPDLAALEV
jgi:Mrp family chromosome partitioning ATPase